MWLFYPSIIKGGEGGINASYFGSFYEACSMLLFQLKILLCFLAVNLSGEIEQEYSILTDLKSVYRLHVHLKPS